MANIKTSSRPSRPRQRLLSDLQNEPHEDEEREGSIVLEPGQIVRTSHSPGHERSYIYVEGVRPDGRVIGRLLTLKGVSKGITYAWIDGVHHASRAEAMKYLEGAEVEPLPSSPWEGYV